MNLPLPVGPDMVLWGFLNHLRAADKEAEVVHEKRTRNYRAFGLSPTAAYIAFG